MGAEIALPVQLLEVLVSLILLQVVFNIERKNLDIDNGYNREGIAFFIALAGHAVFRFIIDFMRDIPEVCLGLAWAQIYSIVCIIASIIVLKKLNSIQIKKI